MSAAAEAVVRAYYAAFNAGDVEGFLKLLAPDVVHDISQGEREVGKPAFRRFLRHMNRCYREQIVDLTIMTEHRGRRAAAEFTVLGTYLKSDKGLPAATGQRYELPAGAFFEIRGGKVARISNHYNLREWLAQVGAGPKPKARQR
jgi:steroid delta-isomerase-like uncharacterized protein